MIVAALQAQSTIPDYGVISEEEKKLTECSFDKEADAVVIFDKATSDHDNEWKLITNRRIRIKILKQKGIEYGNVEIPYTTRNDFEFISDVKASVYNVDNGTVKEQTIPQSSIFRKKVNEAYSLVKFALPDVRIGSIIEFEYTSTKKNYNGLDDWYFQSDLLNCEIPTMLSSYLLSIIPNHEFQYVIHKSAAMPVTVKPDKNDGRILFEMSNVGGLRDEPYMAARKDNLQRVEFQLSSYETRTGDKSRYMTTWAELTRELMSAPVFGSQLNKNVSDAGDVINKAKAMPAPYEKMLVIYNEVQRSIDWNGRKGVISPDGIKTVWEKKKGNSGEINLLLINLLHEAGLEAYPLLVSERDHGKVNPEFPLIEQFNSVMAYVIIDNNKYVLDASGPYTPPFMIPFKVVNTTAFVVDRKKGGIVQLADSERKYKNQVNITGEVDEKGIMKGSADVFSYDYARISRRSAWAGDKEHFKEKFFIGENAMVRVDSLSISNTDIDSKPLEQKFQFEVAPATSGNYTLVSLNLFSGFEKNPFLSDNRFSNIDFGCQQESAITAWVKIPANLQPESLPKDIKLIMPDTSISMIRYIRYDNNVLTARYQVQIRRPVFDVEDYGFVKEFYKKMIELMNEQIVLRRKD